MQMTVGDMKETTKDWLREAAMATFTSRELERMADRKRKMARNGKTKYGISYGLPEGYDEM